MEKADHVFMIGLYLCRQRPTLPHTFACSTIGPAGLNFRVRDGNGWNPRGKITDKSEPSAIGRQLSVTSYCADSCDRCPANLAVPTGSGSLASLRMTIAGNTSNQPESLELRAES